MIKKIKKRILTSVLIATSSIAITSGFFIGNIQSNNAKNVLIFKEKSSVESEISASKIIDLLEKTLKTWINDNQIEPDNIINDSLTESGIKEAIRKQWFIIILKNFNIKTTTQLQSINISINNFIDSSIIPENFLVQKTTNYSINTLNEIEKSNLIQKYSEILKDNLNEWLDNPINYPSYEEAKVLLSGIAPSSKNINDLANNLELYFNDTHQNITKTIKNQRNNLLEKQKKLDEIELAKNQNNFEINFDKNINGVLLKKDDFTFKNDNDKIKFNLDKILIDDENDTSGVFNAINQNNINIIGKKIILEYTLYLNNAKVFLKRKIDNLLSLKIFIDNQLNNAKDNLNKNGNVTQKEESASKNVDLLKIDDFNILNRNSYVEYILKSVEINPSELTQYVLNFDLLFNDFTLVLNSNGDEIQKNSDLSFSDSIKIFVDKLSQLTTEQEKTLEQANSELLINPYIIVNNNFTALDNENENLFSASEILEINTRNINPNYFKASKLNSNYEIKYNKIQSVNDNYGYLNLNYTITSKNDSKIFKTFNRNIIGYRGVLPITQAIKDFNTEKITLLENNFPGQSEFFYNQNVISKLVSSTYSELLKDESFNINITKYNENPNINSPIYFDIYNSVKNTMGIFFVLGSLNNIDEITKSELKDTTNDNANSVIESLKEKLITKGIDPSTFNEIFNEINESSQNLINFLDSNNLTLSKLLESDQLKDFVDLIKKYSNLTNADLDKLLLNVDEIKKFFSNTQKNILYSISAVSGASIFLLAGIIFRINLKKGKKIKSVKAITWTSFSLIFISTAILIFSIIQSLGGL